MDTEGFEPSTSRMRNGRSSTELSAQLATGHCYGGVAWQMDICQTFTFPTARTRAPAIKSEATERIELSTLGLQDQCSTTELHASYTGSSQTGSVVSWVV